MHFKGDDILIHRAMDAPQEQANKEKRSPMESANIFSLLFFWWMNDTLKLGNQRPLQNEDLLPLQDGFKTEALVQTLEVAWCKEKNSSAHKSRRPRLWKAMFRMFSCKNYLIFGVVKLIHSVSNVLLPVMVWFFLSSLSENSNVNRGSTIGHVVGICIMSLMKGISQHHSFFLGGIYGMQLRASVIGLVYKKVGSVNLF